MTDSAPSQIQAEAPFGDFGDFQAAEEHDGELTPTSGSWTFANEGGGSVENIGGGGGGGGSEVESGSNSSLTSSSLRNVGL